MPDLSTFSLINSRVSKIHSEEGNITKGLAFSKLCLSAILKLNEEEIEDAITDGSMDQEVDAIYIYDRIAHIFTFKYTDNFDFSKKNFPESELDVFVSTVDKIISGDLVEKTVNEAVWEKYLEIKELARNGIVDFKIYVVSNKMYPVPHAMLRVEHQLSRYRLVEKPKYLDQEDITNLILDNKNIKVDGTITFQGSQHFEKSDGPIKTVVGVVAASDIVNLVKDVGGSEQINENVFNENIRLYKPDHRINKSIIESAKSDNNYQFFYLNNGITILCEDSNYVPNRKNPVVNLTNFQIINGGQTTHSLFEVYRLDKQKLETIDLLVRLCVAKRNDPISDLISETSNSQIPVGNRDLHSNDTIQRKLEEEFLAMELFYERKPNQYPREHKDKIINNELLGQIYLAFEYDMPSEAKNNKTRVFGDLYDKIFDDRLISASLLYKVYQFYLPVLALKKQIQTSKRSKESAEFVDEKEAFVSRATFHIMTVCKYIIKHKIKEIESQFPNNSKKINAEIENIYSTQRDSIILEAISYVREVVEQTMSARKDLYTHDKFFKETPTSNIIVNYVLQKLNEQHAS